MKKSFTEIATVEVTKLLSPLQELSSAAQIVDFIEDLGWNLGDILSEEFNIELDLDKFISDLTLVVTELIKLADASDEEAIEIAQTIALKIPGLVIEAKVIAEGIEVIVNRLQALPPTENTINIIVQGMADTAELMARRLLDLLLYKYLQRHHQHIFSILHIIGLAELVPDDAGMSIKTIQWERIPQLFTEPGTIINEVYQWDTDLPFEGQKFLIRMDVLLRAFLIPGGIYHQSTSVSTKLKRLEGEDQEIRVPLYQAGVWPDSYMELDLNLSPVPPVRTDQDITEMASSDKAGLFLYPYFMAGVDLSLELSENWDLTFRGSLSTAPTIGLELRPPVNLTFVNELLSGETPLEEAADVQFEMGLVSKTPKDDLILLFGSQFGSRFGYREISLGVMLGLEAGEFAFATEASVNDLTLVIDVGDGDGFIQKILSGVVLESITDLTIGISSKEGFYFKGSSELGITIPIHEQLGPIYLDSVKVALGFGEEIYALIATTFSLELGPIAGTVKNIGLIIPIKIKGDNSGNLGPLDIQKPKFKAPEGAGLAVDAGGLMGGGFLDIDEEAGLYSGILALNFGDFALTAIGLIATKMPDGSKGFSMVINIAVEFSPAIELSYGFSLKGVGGLIGINRSVDTDFLRAGLKAKTLDSILFPENPIANASKIISDMGNAFPIARDRFVIGPMVKINWAGNLISIDICLIIELPAPYRIILLGQVAAILPEKKQDEQKSVIEFHLDVLGILDFSKKELSIDATIFDSSILVYNLYGDAALRLKWGENSVFAMSVGGFHPAFTQPPAFPVLRRLTLALSNSSAISLSCEVYQAITANSLQFGCNIQLHASYSGAVIDGYLTFDTLFYFSPFSFTAAMRAGVSVKYEGVNLASVRLELDLSGPTPWNARGLATFEVLWVDISVDFDKTWGDSRTQELPDINPLPPLLNDLNQNSSWGTYFIGIKNTESFTTDEDDIDIFFMHPAGMLEIREKVLPLNLELDLYANARVKDYKKFTLENVNIYEYHNNAADKKGVLQSPIPVSYIDEDFARGQYISLTKSQKLSQPSFEKMPGGIVTEDISLKIPSAFNTQELVYENILIDDERLTKKPLEMFGHNWFRAKNSLKHTGLRENVKGANKFGKAGKIGQINTLEDKYVIVNAETLEKVEMAGNSGLSLTQIEQLFNQQVTQSGLTPDEMIIVPVHELEAA